MDEPEIMIIDVFVCKLRKKLANASGGKDYIETIWGRGYVLHEPSENGVQVSANSRALHFLVAMSGPTSERIASRVARSSL